VQVFWFFDVRKIIYIDVHWNKIIFSAIANIVCKDVVVNVGELNYTDEHFVDVISNERCQIRLSAANHQFSIPLLYFFVRTREKNFRWSYNSR